MSTSLKAAQLNIPLQATDLGFINTSSLNVEDSFAWIGQTDAAQAANFGLSLFEPGFNMLVLGESGSGRKSLTLKAIQAASRHRAKPYDLVLLYHFDAPEKPLPLYLNAGHGVRLRHEMDVFIRQMMKSIPAMSFFRQVAWSLRPTLNPAGPMANGSPLRSRCSTWDFAEHVSLKVMLMRCSGPPRASGS